MAVAATVAVAVAACGSSSGGSSSTSSPASNGITSKSADQIFDTAITTAEAAKSLHVAGAIKDNGQSIGIDLSILQGTGATGSISEGSASFKLISTGGNDYILPDPAFLLKTTHNKAVAQLLKGKWLKGSSSNGDFASIGPLTSIKSLLGSLTQTHGALTKGTTSTLGGQSVIALTSSKGGTMYVATTGKPYPLEVVKSSGSQVGKITFSEYDESFSITPPAGSINIAALANGGG